MFKAKQFTLPFLRKELVAKDTYSFYFDRSQTDFDFLPGQYIRMSLPHGHPDERGTTRFFTIASSPHEKDYLMFTIKIIESSFKKTLFALEPGQSVQFFGPMGTFVLDGTDTRDRVFLAGGIGMTPFHSMITYAAVKNLQIPMTLFVTFSAPEEVVFYEKLIKIAKNKRNINIIYATNKRISETLIKKYITDTAKPLYYIAGSPSMVEAIKVLLTKMEIAEEKVITEDFSGY